MTISFRHAVLGLAAVALVAAPAPGAINPLDRVPADAGLFAHLQAGDLWNHPAVAALRKAYPKELDKALKAVEDDTGLRPEQIDSITFHYPKLPMGPGDEAVFVFQVTTKKPYAKDTLLKGFRGKDAKANGDIIPLREKLVLQLTSETQFSVLHQSLLDEFQKGASKTTDGAMADALKAARAGKHALVVGFDPSGLPAEIFTAAPPELQPFLPLLKSRSITLTANLDKELTASVRFAQENEEKAIDAERSFNLLMKLADDALTTALGEGAKNEELKAMTPAFIEVQKVVKGLQAKRSGTVVTADVSLKADPVLAKPIVTLFLRPQTASARQRSANNLKQIGLAMHRYLDNNGVFPAAAIVDKKGKPLLSWRVAILPYIEQDNLYKQFHLDEPWDSEHNKKFIKTMPKIYALPYTDGAKPGETNYRVFVGNGSVFDMVQGCKISEITDGTSNTIFAFEGAESTPWTKPDEIEFDPKKPMIKHLRFQDNSACNLLFCDGSVRTVSSKLSEEILRLLIQKDDGMVIPDYE